MNLAGIPTRFQIPFANAAGGSYIRPIPVASQILITPGAASLTDGFPPLNFTPRSAGGVPPFGEDMNGILNQITQWSQWQAAGGPVSYDGTFSTSIGGYPNGAVLRSTVTPNLFWISTVDNNVTDPDSVSAAGWAVYNRVHLAANTTFFVRSDGSDSNNGRTNNAGGAWLTLQHAYNVLASLYDLNGFQAQINISDGNYAGGLVGAGLLVGQTSPLVIQGNIATPANVVIQDQISASQSLVLSVNGFQLTKNNGFQLTASGGGGINFGNINFVGSGALSASIHADVGGTIASNAACNISGGGATFMDADSTGGRINIQHAFTITGAPAYSTAFAYATQGGFILAIGSTFLGGTTGQRYQANLNSIIQTGGGGANFFPGNAAGSVASGGQYF